MTRLECELIGTEVHGRGLYFRSLQRLEEWPDRIQKPDPHFILFLACDASDTPTEAISAFALKTYEQGLAYLCAWGPDCERVHDIFDEVAVGDGVIRQDWDEHDSVVMTTWHDDEDLDEALWFAMYADPHERYYATCDAVLAIVVGNDDWAHHVRQRLADPEGLAADVLDRELPTAATGWERVRSRIRRLGRRPSPPSSSP